ncbi:MAG: TetR/AcrR family transcriptional regulator [Chloroherpetonaceae bacterium]
MPKASLKAKPAHSESKERVLEAAEKHFTEKGFAAVSLRDIASELGMKQASLYYHAPDGKEQLFVESLERALQKHFQGIENAIMNAKPNLDDQFLAVALWFFSQPPVDLMRMAHADMPKLPKRLANRFMEISYQSLLSPIEKIVVEAQKRGELRKEIDETMIAGGFFSIIQSLQDVRQYAKRGDVALAKEAVDLILNGARKK